DGRACLMRYWNELEIFRCADGSQTLATKIAEDIVKNYGATIRMRRAVTAIDIRTQKCAQKKPGVDPNKPCVVLESRQVIKPDGTLARAADPMPSHNVSLAIPPSVWKGRVVKGVKKGEKIPLEGKPPPPADADKIGLRGMDPAVKFFVNLTER